MSEHFARIQQAAEPNKPTVKDGAPAIEGIALQPTFGIQPTFGVAGCRGVDPEWVSTSNDELRRERARFRQDDVTEVVETPLISEIRSLEPSEYRIPQTNRDAFDDGPFMSPPTPSMSLASPLPAFQS